MADASRRRHWVFTHGGLHYALRVCLGTAILWLLLPYVPYVGRANPIWAVVSFIVVSEARTEDTAAALRQRVLNTLVGCAVALVTLLVVGTRTWGLPLAAGAAVLICTASQDLPKNWKMAPVTAALVLAPATLQHTREAGMITALERTAEVLVGSALAVALTWAWLRAFPDVEPTPARTAATPPSPAPAGGAAAPVAPAPREALVTDKG